MSVEATQISIDPYKSQVPLVQIPQQDLQGPPQQGAIYSKTGGIATIADGAMKGLLRGLQMKEEKKYKTAEAVMNAQNVQIAAAKKNYENVMITKGDSPEAQAAHAAYVSAVNQAADQFQSFVQPKKEGKTQRKKDQADAKKPHKEGEAPQPVTGGFGAAIKQFFERNPQVLPELTITAMKSSVTPYGQMGPEQQRQKMQLDADQRIEANQKVVDSATATKNRYGGKSDDELAAMPATPNADGTPNKLFKNALEEKNNAIAALMPVTPTGKSRIVVSETDPSDYQTIPEYAQIPRGYKPYEKPTSLTTTKPGTEQDFTKNALAGYGVDDRTPPGKKAELEKYLHDWWGWKQSQNSTSTATSTTDKDGNRTNTNRTTRGAAEPKPPTGFAPVGENGQPLKPDATQTMATPNPKGLVEPGNLPIWNRPTVQNADGSHSSEYSTSFEQDGKEVLVPTVVNGKFLTPDGKKPKPGSPEEKAMFKAAWQHYLDTGENLGKFDNADNANAYAQILHNRGSGRGKITAPPSDPAAPAGGKGRITPPPSADGKQTLTSVNRTMKVETEEKGMYDKATAAYQKALAANKKNSPDPAASDAKSLVDYNAAKAQIVLWKAGQIKAIGGDPWKTVTHNGQQVQFSQGPDGTYGTMDGVNWVNIKTGLPYKK